MFPLEDFFILRLSYRNYINELKEGTFHIKGVGSHFTNDFHIFDDNGTLIDENFIVCGFIFYREGLVVISKNYLYGFLTTSFVNSFDGDDQDLLDNLEWYFVYDYEYDIEYNSYIAKLNSGELKHSSNLTFKKQTKPFVTKVGLFNSKNELIAYATLSKPVSSDADVLFVLDDYSPLV